MHKNKKAFTLIELMIVMAIIAVLVGMILPRFRGMRDQANISKAQGEVRAIKTAIESYFIRNSIYPITTTTVCATNLTTATTFPRILESNLYDPFGATATTEYRYICSANRQYYVIFSIGPNATANTTAISNAGVITPAAAVDDVRTSNGSGT
ncbi:MAG: prepilin-type N-terminal cleavage/methylation domain-containing protein [Candidatus Omnitrophota bacterium]|nr:prepilin-type N-terminal cleavage/methylation domain-containing protein [Candidatus Omnitrophota bacterium]